jgi:arabinose-5-phosphate isomerase
MTMDSIIEIGKDTLKKEADAIVQLIHKIDESFEKAVDLILSCTGLVIVIGMGKSGHIGRKIAATLTSTGTRSVFMHPGEGEHGDLGIISKDDVCLILSHSGNTEEITKILPMIKRNGASIISISANEQSKIATSSNVFLNTFVTVEADPLNLAPTSSSTVTLALGDALAVTLLRMKQFSEKDFAGFHPGGMLGKKLLLKVSDIMFDSNDIVLAKPSSEIKEVLFKMTEKKIGFAVVIDDDKKVIGLITDGDIRRSAIKNPEIFLLNCKDIMHINPYTIKKDILAYDALKIMKEKKISCLIVAEDDTLIGAIDIEEIARTGLKE